MKHATRLSIYAATAAVLLMPAARAESPHGAEPETAHVAVPIAGPVATPVAAPLPAHAAEPEHAPAHAAAPGRAPTPDEVLAILKAGNVRFAAGSSRHPHVDAERRIETSDAEQTPIAAVLSCADSRVPAELIFDAGVGDLFVTRVAGNIACTTEIGTLEYGVAHLHAPLIVVMGHSKCGAVTAAVLHAEVEGSIPSVIQHIAPAVAVVEALSPKLTAESLIVASTRANVNQSIQDMLQGSEILRSEVANGHLKIVGAIYDLHDGTVAWTGEHPQQAALLGTQHAVPAAPSADVEKEVESPVDVPVALETPAEHAAAPASAKKPAAH